MAKTDRFLIGPQNGSFQTDLKPWAIPDDAFQELNNAYVFRGRIRKRFGSILMNSDQKLSRLRIQVGTLGAPSSPVPGNVFKIGQIFSVGPDLFTVITAGVAQPMLSTNPLASGTYSTTNGAFVIVDPSQIAGTPIYFYPAEPVMGLTNYEKGPINNQPSYAFDTQFAYKYSTGWERSGTLLFLNGADPDANLNYVWTFNWEGITPDIQVLFATNFQVTNPEGARVATDDPIWYTPDGTNWFPLNASTAGPAGYTNAFYFLPSSGIPPVELPPFTGPYVLTAKIIVAFKDRLVLLNTIENDNPNGDGTAGTNTSYPNRARFSFNGSPFARNAWYEPNTSDDGTGAVGNNDIAAGGGWIDATTDEQIVSAEFIKDRLIVYFERSTWELAYTGNDKQPFLWQKLNTELGADSTFSVVPFDKEILCISNVGVHSCNGSNVARIDQKIPDQVFKIKNAESDTLRVAGIRDYQAETVYWTYPQSGSIFTFNTKILVYNYKNGSWAINDDCINVWGYFEQQTDTTWASSAPIIWQQFTETWDSGVTQAQERQIIAGNQQGYTFIISFDITTNAPAMQLTNIAVNADPDYLDLTIIDHTLSAANPGNGTGDYIYITNSQGVTNLNGNIYAVVNIPGSYNQNTIQILKPAGFSGTYTGGGQIQRVSNPQILSKQWNPYDSEGRNLYLSKVDFLVDKTSDGQVTVDYIISAQENWLNVQEAFPGITMGNNVLETSPFASIVGEQFQVRLWHPVYFQADGESAQLYIYMSDEQIRNPAIAFSDLQIHAMILSCTRTSSRLQ